MYNLERFIEAQQFTHGVVVRELQQGCKQSHWMWYTFPQYAGLGNSYNSAKYAIRSEEEARAYLNNNILNENIRRLCKILLSHKDITAHDIFGFPDDLKLQSSMTLFDFVCPNDVFGEVLKKYYDGEKCLRTIDFLKNDCARGKNNE